MRSIRELLEVIQVQSRSDKQSADALPAQQTGGGTGSDVMSTRPGETPPILREAREQFIAAWGQMGSNWGIPRTMAEVHSLLFILGRPLNTDDVMEYLEISRGNASMTLRSLLEWGLTRRVHIRGDRKEYFEAEQDVWKLFRTILRERKKREVDPVLESLQRCRDLTADVETMFDPARPGAGQDAATVRSHNERLDSMLSFMTLIDMLSRQLSSPTGMGLQEAATILQHLLQPGADSHSDSHQTTGEGRS